MGHTEGDGNWIAGLILKGLKQFHKCKLALSGAGCFKVRLLVHTRGPLSFVLSLSCNAARISSQEPSARAICALEHKTCEFSDYL